MDVRIEKAIDDVVSAFDTGLDAAKSEARGDHVYYDFPISKATNEFKKSLTVLVKLLLDDD